MTEDGTKQGFLEDLVDVVHDHGHHDEPPPNARPDYEPDGADSRELARWLRQAADSLEVNGWAEAIDTTFGTGPGECNRKKCPDGATHALDYGDGSRGTYCDGCTDDIIDDAERGGWFDELAVKELKADG